MGSEKESSLMQCSEQVWVLPWNIFLSVDTMEYGFVTGLALAPWDGMGFLGWLDLYFALFSEAVHLVVKDHHSGKRLTRCWWDFILHNMAEQSHPRDAECCAGSWYIIYTRRKRTLEDQTLEHVHD